jgi:peptidoglycan/LPS O-acetylase OafA/YrhL
MTVLGTLTGLLRRRTASTIFIPQIDGLRFYAVVGVLLYHCTGYLMWPGKNPAASAVAATWIGSLSKAGHLGVELFFVLSGFVLGLPFAKAAAGLGTPVRLTRYYLRRLTRLEPPYIIHLLLLTAVLIATGKTTLSAVVPHLAASLGYCHNAIYGRGSDVNSVAWTLEIEVQFYVLAPLLAGLFWIRDGRARRLAFAACMLAGSVAAWRLHANPATPSALRLSLACFLPYFLGGFALADWYVRDPEPGVRTRSADLLGLPCAAAPFVLEGFPSLQVFLLPLAFGGLCYSALRGVWHSRLTAHPLLVVIGGMCYTIYLYHTALMAFFGRFIVRATPVWLPIEAALPLQLAAFGAVIIAVCIPLFLCFEKPFMAIGARRHA